jgi:hypothetical protein
MADARSAVGVIVCRVDAGRRAIPQPILVGSARHRVAIQRRTTREHGRGKLASVI